MALSDWVWGDPDCGWDDLASSLRWIHVASESIRWIQSDYVAFGRCVRVEYLGGLEALNASFAVFGIGVAHAFDMVVRFVRKGDVSVRVSLFFEGVDRDNR